jgi:hypothetical protein
MLPRLKVTVTRPPATVELPLSFVIQRTIYFPWFKRDSHPSFYVAETSKKAPLTISGIRPTSYATVGNRPVAGQLKFDEGQPPIGAGQQATLAYRLEGDFPIGTATGTMKVEAPQLAAAAAFNYEVRTRVHLAYIGIAVAIGLLASYWLKVKLHQKIELEQARLDAEKLIERIQGEANRHIDAKFLASYATQLRDLEQSLNGHDATGINEAKTKLDTAWRNALQELASRHQQALDGLEKVRVVTAYIWAVPTPVAQAVDAAGLTLAQAAEAIERDDLEGANTKVRQGILDLGNTIMQAAVAWQARQEAVLTSLSSSPPGIPAPVSAAMVRPATDLRALIRKVDPNNPLSTPEQIQRALTDIQSEYSGAQQFYSWLTSAMQMECENANAQIGSQCRALWNYDKFTAAADQVARFTTFARGLANEGDFTRLPGELGAVHEAWTNALQGQFDSPNPPVQQALDAREYVSATRIACAQKLTATLPKTAILSPADGLAFPVPEFTPGQNPIPAGYILRTRIQPAAMPSPAMPTRISNEQELKKAKRTQTLLVGAILILAAYGLQADTFSGTFTEFSMLFFWAFGLDLTVDQIGKIAKKP